MRARGKILRWGAALFVAVAAQAFIVVSPLAEHVPMERLLRNAQRDLKNAPDSAEAHYVVARLHYQVFSTGLTFDWGEFPQPDLRMLRQKRAEELAREDIGEMKQIVPVHKKHAFNVAVARRLRQLEQSGWTPATSLAPSVTLGHAAEAMREVQAALRLAPESERYALLRASLAEQFVDWQRQVKTSNLPPELAGLSTTRVREFYLEAFRLGYKAKDPQKKKCSDFTDPVTREAAAAVLRLAEKEPQDPAAQQAREEVATKLETMKTWPTDEVVQLISPIVFAPGGERELAALLDPAVKVSFDLRGFGPRERWPWLRPAAALLVWDPTASGVIVSGRQLFGSYTFQIAWPTGYDALAALDDNGDGELTGEELRGIRAWFDRDGNGESSPDEVCDLATLGIVGIAVRATGSEGVHPMNAAGMRLADGRTLPTWDWMAEPQRK